MLEDNLIFVDESQQIADGFTKGLITGFESIETMILIALFSSMGYFIVSRYLPSKIYDKIILSGKFETKLGEFIKDILLSLVIGMLFVMWSMMAGLK